MCLLTVTTDLNRAKLRTHLAALVERDLVHADTLTPLGQSKDQPATWWRSSSRFVGHVDIVFPYSVVTLASRTSGHSHVLVQDAMTWEQTQFLTNQLAAAGVVDPNFAAVTAAGDFAYVNNAVRDHDAVH